MPNKDDPSTYAPIQCQIYDYIEIACMRHYNLDIELTTGEIVTGNAQTTRVKDKQEFMVIDIESDSENTHQSKELEIRLDTIKSITALDNNAEFRKVAIN